MPNPPDKPADPRPTPAPGPGPGPAANLGLAQGGLAQGGPAQGGLAQGGGGDTDPMGIPDGKEIPAPVFTPRDPASLLAEAAQEDKGFASVMAHIAGLATDTPGAPAGAAPANPPTPAGTSRKRIPKTQLGIGPQVAAEAEAGIPLAAVDAITIPIVEPAKEPTPSSPGDLVPQEHGVLASAASDQARAHVVATVPKRSPAPQVAPGGVLVKGGAPFLVGDERARRLPSGDPKAQTMKVRFKDGRPLEEKADVAANLMLAGIAQTEEERARNEALLSQADAEARHLRAAVAARKRDQQAAREQAAAAPPAASPVGASPAAGVEPTSDPPAQPGPWAAASAPPAPTGEEEHTTTNGSATDLASPVSRPPMQDSSRTVAWASAAVLCVVAAVIVYVATRGGPTPDPAANPEPTPRLSAPPVPSPAVDPATPASSPANDASSASTESPVPSASEIEPPTPSPAEPSSAIKPAPVGPAPRPRPSSSAMVPPIGPLD
jgi:hypothetical protein